MSSDADHDGENQDAPKPDPVPGAPADTDAAAPRRSARQRSNTEAARELRNAVTSLRSAAGALFGNVQPAIKDVLDEADRVYQQAKASAKPAVTGAAEEAGRMVKQIGESAEPLARTMGSELHKLSDVMAEAVEGAVKGARGAVSVVRQAADPALDEERDQDGDEASLDARARSRQDAEHPERDDD
jgi:hypothetical protein